MDYTLKPIGRECAGTGEPLEPGSRVHSALVRVDGEWERRDFSEEGWEGPPEGTVGYWTTDVPVPEEKPRVLDPEGMMRFLEQLTEEANPTREPLRYVLALLLVRKRRLEIEESLDDDGDDDTLVLNGLRGEGRFEVTDPGLGPDEIETLQRELNAHLFAAA